MKVSHPHASTREHRASIRFIIVLALLLVVSGIATAPAVAQEFQAQLVEPDESSESFFGASVAVDGEWAFVGAPFNSESGAEAGVVYVYRFNGVVWTRTQKLFPVDGSANSGWFGFSLAVDDDLVAIGSPQSPRDGASAGAVSVFRRHEMEWIPETRLTAPGETPGVAFGASVAIDGERILVGASSDSEKGPRSGAAYVFNRNASGWQFDAKLSPDVGQSLDAFGKAVALDGDRALIGAPWTRHEGVDAGSAFIFERQAERQTEKQAERDGSTWKQTAHLVGQEAASGDMLGESVSLYGDVAAVGASRAEECEAGAVYIYRHEDGSWEQESRLTAPVIETEHLFGASVSVRDSVLLVGAPFFRDSQAPGSVYRFDRNDDAWILTAEIRSPGAEDANHFGQSVCWSGDTMIAGAFRERAHPGTDGSAFIYAVPDVGPLRYTLIYPW